MSSTAEVEALRRMGERTRQERVLREVGRGAMPRWYARRLLRRLRAGAGR